MEPIISPVWIYLIHFTGMINAVASGILVICLIGLIVPIMSYIGDGRDPRDSDFAVGIMTLSIIGLIISTILLVIVPDEKTMIAMLASTMITPDNITGVEDHVVELIKEIATAVYDAGK